MVLGKARPVGLSRFLAVPCGTLPAIGVSTLAPNRGCVMARVMIKCPVRGKAVPTGMEADEAAFKSVKYENNEFGCPACGQIHTWSKEDAFLEE